MSLIYVPGDHMLMSGDLVIPEIEGDFGRHWRQPYRSELLFEISKGINKGEIIHVYMNLECLNTLAWYSSTTPSGVYPGKMWKMKADDVWHLCWYAESSLGLYKCSIQHTPIMLTDLLDLINPAGAGADLPIPF